MGFVPRKAIYSNYNRNKRKQNFSLHDLGSNISNAVHDAVTNVQQTTQTAINNIQQTGQAALNNVQQTTSNVVHAAGVSVSNALHGVAATVVNKLDGIKTNIGFVVLGVYKPMMAQILRNKGMSVPSNASTAVVATMFYNVIILKRSSYDYKRPLQNLTDQENAMLTSTAAGAGGLAVAAASDGAIPPGVATAIIKKIIEFFKNIKKKKDAGQTLTPEEQIIDNNLDATVNVPIPVTPDGSLSATGGTVYNTSGEGWFMRLIHSIFGYPHTSVSSYNKQNFRRRIEARQKHPVTVVPNNTGQLVTAGSDYVNPVVNDTEGALLGAINADGYGGGFTKNIPTKGVIASAGDMVNYAKQNYQPNSWYKDKHGNWHWANSSGKLVSFDKQNYQKNSWYKDKRGTWHWVDSQGKLVG